MRGNGSVDSTRMRGAVSLTSDAVVMLEAFLCTIIVLLSFVAGSMYSARLSLTSSAALAYSGVNSSIVGVGRRVVGGMTAERGSTLN